MRSRSIVTRPLVAAVGVAAITSVSRWWKRRASGRVRRISLTALGNDRSLRAGSEPIGSVSVRALGGTASLDLRRAMVGPDVEPTISVLVVAGTVEITVPDTWDVQVDASTFGGRVTHHSGSAGGGGPTIHAAVRTVIGHVAITGRPVIRAAKAQTIRR